MNDETSIPICFTFIENYNLTRYPTYTSTNVCRFNFKAWISDPNGISIPSITSSIGSPTVINYNSTHVIYYEDFETSLGSTTLHITIKNSIDETSTSDHTCNCLALQENEIDFQAVGGIYYDTLGIFSIMVKRVGIPSYSNLPVNVDNKGGYEFIMGDGIHSRVSIPFYLISTFTNQIKIDFTYDVVSYKSLMVPNYFNLTYKSDFQLIYTPTKVNDSLVLMGKELVPSFTFTVNSQSDIEPLFSSENNDDIGISRATYRPIYESNGKTTFIASYYFSSVSLVYDFTFYAQEFTQSVAVYNQHVSLIDAPYSILSTSSLTCSIETEAVVCNLYITGPPNEIYKLNKIRFSKGLVNNKLMEAPFGFGPGSNSNLNYEFLISIPYFKKTFKAYYYMFGQKSGGDIVAGNADDLGLTLLPELKSFQFQFISNSKYLLGLTIESALCGVSAISFDGVTFKRISQFRVGGNSLSGTYEIPIDLETDSSFYKISLLDLCDNQVEYKNGDQIDLLTVLDIPFLNNWRKVDLTSIKDVSFLYNNLNVSKDSVTNVIYFNYPNYDIKNAPFAIRLPYIETKDTAILYTREYFGKWNSELGRFEIEFKVPKNSRVGRFDYAISLGGNAGDYISSTALSSDAQLYIKYSNFDGIGPVFSNVASFKSSTVPIDYIGWILTISDPINGFESAEITVMGSLDNSIYKFNLTPNDRISGDATLGDYNITVRLVEGFACVNQDYIITKAILYDTAGQKTKFERDLSEMEQYSASLVNPFYLISSDPSIISIGVTCDNSSPDTTPPTLLLQPILSLDVGSANSREITLSMTATDPESGVNYLAQGPIVYLISDNFETIQCIGILVTHTTTTAYYSCTLEVPYGFGSEFGKIYVSVYSIINNHGYYKAYTSSMLNLNIPATFAPSTIDPILLESGLASSNGGELYFTGRNLDSVATVYINYTESGGTLQELLSSDFNCYGSSLISISKLRATKSNFYVYVKTSIGTLSNSLLVSPVIHYDYTPTITVPPTLPTNQPQQCKGSPVCGGPTNGYCDPNSGCKCYTPWVGNDCLSKVIEVSKPQVNISSPSTLIEVTSENTDIVQFKSLISIYSLREIGLGDKILNEYPLHNQSWLWVGKGVNGEDSIINTYYLNFTNKNNIDQTTQISVKLEWFNVSKTVIFAGQNIEMNASSMKYTIEISNYQFNNQLSRLQLVISTSFSSTLLSDSLCSSKEFGETSSGDNSNYLKIQIDNKSLYTRLIKRAILDESRVTPIENTILDSLMNPIETSSQLQSFIGINIPLFEEKVIVDPDFSVLLDSSSVDKSYSNSICSNKSKSLSKSQLAGIIVGGVVFIVIIVLVILVVLSKSFKYKSKSLLKLHLKVRGIYDK